MAVLFKRWSRQGRQWEQHSAINGSARRKNETEAHRTESAAELLDRFVVRSVALSLLLLVAVLFLRLLLSSVVMATPHHPLDLIDKIPPEQLLEACDFLCPKEMDGALAILDAGCGVTRLQAPHRQAVYFCKGYLCLVDGFYYCSCHRPNCRHLLAIRLMTPLQANCCVTIHCSTPNELSQRVLQRLSSN